MSTFKWTGLVDSNWSNPGNWSPNSGVPNSSSDIAQFTGSYSVSQAAVNLDINAVIAEIDFGSSSNITISSNNASGLTLTASSGSSIISLGSKAAANSGTDTFAVPVTVTGTPMAATLSGGALVVSGAGSIQGSPAVSFKVMTGGALTVDDSVGSPNNNRIKDTASLTLAGGAFNYVGNSANSTETIGA
ncbi:MAG TPA: hypothetical protein VE988_23575, partial [Gemmataceae bacterium]|nr:hypothetical protein [Gemmataceae bacterium]